MDRRARVQVRLLEGSLLSWRVTGELCSTSFEGMKRGRADGEQLRKGKGGCRRKWTRCRQGLSYERQ